MCLTPEMESKGTQTELRRIPITIVCSHKKHRMSTEQDWVLLKDETEAEEEEKDEEEEEEGESEKIILVVQEQEFSLGRRALASRSDYFRAMLEGNFEESSSKRVELRGVTDPRAFQAFLDYLLMSKPDFVLHAPLLASALVLADMFCQDDVPLRIRMDLFQHWSRLDDIRHILDISRWLKNKMEILDVVFKAIKTVFTRYGMSLEFPDCGLDMRADSILNDQLVLSVFQAQETRWFCFEDFGDESQYFTKGILAWAAGYNVPVTTVRKIVQCLRFGYLKEPRFKDIYLSLPDMDLSLLFRKELELEFDGMREKVRDAVSQICFGDLLPALIVYSFDTRAWEWRKTEICGNIRTTTEVDNETLDPLNCVCFSMKAYDSAYFFSPEDQDENGRFDFLSCATGIRCYRVPDMYGKHFFMIPPLRNNVLQCGRLYCAGVKRFVDAVSSPGLLIYRFVRQDDLVLASVVAHLAGLVDVGSCQLVLVHDALHGFVCIKSARREGTTFAHFSVPVDPHREPPSEQEPFDEATAPRVQLEDLLIELPKNPRNVAAVATGSGVLLLFVFEPADFWLARYDCTTRGLEPIGFLPQVVRKPGVERQFVGYPTYNCRQFRVPMKKDPDFYYLLGTS